MSTSLTSKTLMTLFIVIILSSCSITRALRIEDHATVDIPTMIDEIGSVPIVFVGELHDDMQHHKLQLEVMQRLKAQGKSLAIGMEMFEISSQGTLDAWSSGRISRGAFIRTYQRNWRHIPYWLYEDIFNYARDNRIPIIALNAPRGIVTKVSRNGFSSLNSDERQQLPPGADEPVSDTYLDFIRRSYAVHGSNGDQFRNICEAQMLRNRVMASRIRDYHQRHPDRVMVVIAGGGHARKKGGIPAELGTIPYKIILPPVPGLDNKTISPGDADFLLE